MRWTQIIEAQFLRGRAVICGRRSRVVLTPRRWRQVGDNACRIALVMMLRITLVTMPRIAPAMVTTKPGRQEEREGNR
jgi:hypothetical protein